MITRSKKISLSRQWLDRTNASRREHQDRILTEIGEDVAKSFGYNAGLPAITSQWYAYCERSAQETEAGIVPDAPLDLAPILFRLSIATPGEWDYLDDIRVVEHAQWMIIDPCEREVASVPHNECNALFLTHAKGDIAALVGEVLRLRRQLMELDNA